MRRTLDSVAQQTAQPALWVIVDDGSSDETPAILREYAARLPYLRIVRRDNRGARSVGPGVIDAFYDGLAGINLNDFDYLCKLDLDLDLPARYFATLIERMESNPRIGTTSGKPYFVDPRKGKNGTGDAGKGSQPEALVSELCGDEMSVGMTKFYRVACFQEIGGFVRQVMWDGIDCHRCRMLGWIAESRDGDDLRFLHLRPMGSSQKSIWAGRVRWGFGQYFMGTAPIYLAASAVYRMPRHPLLVGGIAMLWGYLKSAATGASRYDDPEFRRFLRTYQTQCLLRGKAEATRALNAQQATLWQERHGHGHGPSIDSAAGNGGGR
jgi:hypothetical protein